MTKYEYLAELEKNLDMLSYDDKNQAMEYYENYFEVYKQMDKVYKNKLQFQKMSLVNISEAGRFAADRSIEDYARDIWHLKKLK